MTSGDWGPLDRLVALAETLGSAWGARARASTTIGQERAILRMLGVGGVDVRGRPLASEVVEGFLGHATGRLGAGILLPFSMAMIEYDLGPQQLALDVAGGTIDLAFESQLLSDPDRRGAAEREAQMHVDAAFERIDANRTARHELMAILGEPARPWFGLNVLESTLDGATAEVGRLVASGVDLLRIAVPVNRELATIAGANATAPPANRLTAASAGRAAEAGTQIRLARETTPAGSQRGVAALRHTVDEMAAERGGYIRLSTVAPPLAAPEAAVVAAFERVDLVQADPMAEIVGVGVDPDRALADHSFAHRLLARAGTPVMIGPGPLVVGPDLATGRPSDPATRAGRALALQLLSVALARTSGLTDPSILVGAMPAWLSDERQSTVLAIGQVALRRAVFAQHPLVFEEPLESVASEGWPFMFAATVAGAGPIALVLRRAEVQRVGQVGEATRAAVRVARETELALGPRSLHGDALEHARRSVDSALALLQRIADQGWPAVLGLAAAPGAAHLGGEAVADRSEDFDVLAARPDPDLASPPAPR